MLNNAIIDILQKIKYIWIVMVYCFAFGTCNIWNNIKMAVNYILYNVIEENVIWDSDIKVSY